MPHPSDVDTAFRHRRMRGTRPCNCPLNSGQETYQYLVLGMEFRLNQELVRQHREGCTYYGIPRKQKRTLQAQFPIMFGQFLGRLNRACVEYAVGTSRPGISLRFRNIVPRNQSPIIQIFYDQTDRYHHRLTKSLRNIHKVSPEEAFCRLKQVENAVLSLYREKKSSPWDLTEDGDSHETVSRPTPQPGSVSTYLPTLELTLGMPLDPSRCCTRYLLLPRELHQSGCHKICPWVSTEGG